MDLHNEIMNISVKHETISSEVGNPRDYKLGHRDARHAAAELSLKADARIKELERMLKRAYELEYIDGDWVSDYQKIIGG